MGEDGWLTSSEVCERLGLERTTVYRIPAQDLPFTPTPGGSLRKGRRRYRLEHVERYLLNRAQQGTGMAAIEERLSAVERRLDEHEQAHQQAGQ